MQIKSAKFITSNVNYKLCPPENMPEYAFIGRSNVGKSSLINMLCNQKSLAKTSSTPGKTQLINHFVINENEKPWYLVDLPGYGYAKIGKKSASKWTQFTVEYIKYRKNLLCLFVLIDVRHKPQLIDLEFMGWLAENEIAFVILFTKADKLKTGELKDNIKSYQTELLKDWEEIPQFFVTSAEKYLGKDEILKYIAETNNIFR